MALGLSRSVFRQTLDDMIMRMLRFSVSTRGGGGRTCGPHIFFVPQLSRVVNEPMILSQLQLLYNKCFGEEEPPRTPEQMQHSLDQVKLLLLSAVPGVEVGGEIDASDAC